MPAIRDTGCESRISSRPESSAVTAERVPPSAETHSTRLRSHTLRSCAATTLRAISESFCSSGIVALLWPVI
jgi:hypothetical protein